MPLPVIQAFGEVVGGNHAVCIVCSRSPIINFVVVTKGGRISEVSARLPTPCPASRWPSTPTSTPASIDQKPPSRAGPKLLRKEFYGSMDGASICAR